jgi:hypothetical protein
MIDKLKAVAMFCGFIAVMVFLFWLDKVRFVF